MQHPAISTLESLERLFPGAHSISTRQLATALHLAQKTIHNRGDGFPIRSYRVGRSRLYRLIDVARFIDKALGLEETEEDLSGPSDAALAQPVVARKPGRPRNADRAVIKGARA